MIDFRDFNKNSLILKESFEAFKEKNNIELITDESHKQELIHKVLKSIEIPFNVKVFTFENLFKFHLKKGTFFIAQCLLDYGYPLSQSGFPSSIHKYDFQLIGFANIKFDLGKTYIYPLTGMKATVFKFFKKNIYFPKLEKFNSSYFIESNKPEILKATLNEEFLNVIAGYENIFVTINNSDMYIYFNDNLKIFQSEAIEEILSNYKFLV